MAILTLFRQRFYNNDGTVAAGGKVYTYDAGTTTPAATYTTSAAAVANSNPIILDSKGEADIWVNTAIKVNLLQSNDVQVTGWPVDNINTESSYIFQDRGNFNASVNTFPTTGGSGTAGAIKKGDLWTVSVVATSGPLNTYLAGTTVRSLIDTPGQTAGNWVILDVGLGASNASAVAAAASAAVSASAASASATTASTQAGNALTSANNAALSEAAALAYAQAMNLNATTDTSATSNAIGTGAKTFAVTAGKSFIGGMFLVIADTAAPSTNSMYGQITSYSGTALVVNVLSVLGSGTKTSWLISQTSAANMNVDTATTANRVDSGMSNVTIHATTSDIFGSASNSILYGNGGGTITTIAFALAPKAGITRTLILNNEWSVTASANLLITGISSGTTITLGAGAVVEIISLAVSQWRITRYSYSGSFTGTAVGLTTSPTTVCTYTHSNGIVHLHIPSGDLTGTSNANNFYMSGVPVSISSSTNYLPAVGAVNNGTAVLSPSLISTGVLTFYNGVSGGLWTTSGTKTLVGSEFIYTIR